MNHEGKQQCFFIHHVGTFGNVWEQLKQDFIKRYACDSRCVQIGSPIGWQVSILTEDELVCNYWMSTSPSVVETCKLLLSLKLEE